MRLPDCISSDPLLFHASSFEAWCHARQMAPQDQSAWQMYFNQRKTYEVKNGIAMIHVNDALGPNLAQIDKMTGMTDYADLTAEIRAAVNDAQVKGIFLDINSPGGSAVGAPEAAAAVAAARDAGKRVVANIQTIGASAAYYVAAAANDIVAAPSSIVGSVGTIAIYQNFAGMLAAFGVQVTIFTPAQSDLKAAGNKVRQMTPEEQAFLQSSIEATNKEFLNWVMTNRSVGPASLRGQWFSGKQALQAGLVTRLGTTEDALAMVG
jgi:signal peptide peptidase SppA